MFPQELIDLVLANTDKESLKSCALVARSFRPTSQMLIFSDLTILPSGCNSLAALQRLADVLSASPRLAQHVRTLHLVQPELNKPCEWMQSDILPTMLHELTNLESLKPDHPIFALLHRTQRGSLAEKPGTFVFA
ncbi:hypothetical protein B0H12DRAFT_340233 [Mycena haematopus]|nr:hypothetical protein B0H12DRAFT_340233 [Mycena haematopus]